VLQLPIVLVSVYVTVTHLSSPSWWFLLLASSRSLVSWYYHSTV